jgi:hypothetical protein
MRSPKGVAEGLVGRIYMDGFPMRSPKGVAEGLTASIYTVGFGPIVATGARPAAASDK